MAGREISVASVGENRDNGCLNRHTPQTLLFTFISRRVPSKNGNAVEIWNSSRVACLPACHPIASARNPPTDRNYQRLWQRRNLENHGDFTDFLASISRRPSEAKEIQYTSDYFQINPRAFESQQASQSLRFFHYQR